MNEFALYALALTAIKKASIEAGVLNVEVPLKAWVVVARSSEEATTKGLAIALEEWRECDGWTKHAVDLPPC